jgi:hypothetical protein
MRIAMNRRMAVIGAGLLLVAIAAGVTSVSGGYINGITRYHLVDARTIAIEVITGDLSWTRVTEIAETNDKVRIVVRTLTAPVPMSNVGRDLELTVSLKEPLGDRMIIDGNDHSPPSTD